MSLSKIERRIRIKKGVRKNLIGTGNIPRLSVYRSNKEIYAQIIDDIKQITLVSFNSLNKDDFHNIPKIEQAKKVGEKIAELAIQKNIEKIVFDRNGYLYHGRIKALADAARKKGLKF